MTDIEVGADRYEAEQAEAQHIRYQDLIEEYMLELDCSREVAEALIEQEAGANPDAHYGPIY